MLGRQPRCEAGARLEVGSREGEGAQPGGGSVLQLIEAKKGKRKSERREHLDVVNPGSHSPSPWCVAGPSRNLLFVTESEEED